MEHVVANDYSSDAVEAIRINAKLNDVEHLVQPSYGDAVYVLILDLAYFQSPRISYFSDIMMQHRAFDKRFHAVDLVSLTARFYFGFDISQFRIHTGRRRSSSILQSSRSLMEVFSYWLSSPIEYQNTCYHLGILMVTCTDMATLCGNTPEACLNKYGSTPLKHRSCHEAALRILIRAIDSHAVRVWNYSIRLCSTTSQCGFFSTEDTSSHSCASVWTSTSDVSLSYTRALWKQRTVHRMFSESVSTRLT